LDGRSIAARTLIQAGVIAVVVLLVMLLLNATEVFLVGFGGILFAILFRRSAVWVARVSGLSDGLALLIAAGGPLLLIGLGAWLIAADVAEQSSELVERLPEAMRRVEQEVRDIEWMSRVLDELTRLRTALPGGEQALGFAAQFFASTFGALANLLFALVLGLFLAVDPRTYICGMVALVPPARRERTREVLVATGDSLAAWLAAKLIEMVIVGVLTTLGLWLIGIDLALVLGLIAGLLAFVPNIGPVVAVVPAALIALVAGTKELLWVLVMYTAVQSLESYLLTPYLQKRLVDLPPALTIASQILLGVIAGVIGLIMATPLLAAAIVMIRMWYVEDVLEKRAGQGDGVPAARE